jgi:hypothetical protein
LIPNIWSLSTKPARRRRWLACAVAPDEESDVALQFRMATGKRPRLQVRFGCRDDRAHGSGWIHDRGMLRRLRPADPGTNAAAGRHRDPRQSPRAQKRCRARRYRGSRRADAVPPAIFADFNPIENAFSKLKAILRKAAARTVPDLWDAIRDALPRISPNDCANYFSAAGYEPE